MPHVPGLTTNPGPLSLCYCGVSLSMYKWGPLAWGWLLTSPYKHEHLNDGASHTPERHPPGIQFATLSITGPRLAVSGTIVTGLLRSCECRPHRCHAVTLPFAAYDNRNRQLKPLGEGADLLEALERLMQAFPSAALVCQWEVLMCSHFLIHLPASLFTYCPCRCCHGIPDDLSQSPLTEGVPARGRLRFLLWCPKLRDSSLILSSVTHSL